MPDGKEMMETGYVRDYYGTSVEGLYFTPFMLSCTWLSRAWVGWSIPKAEGTEPSGGQVDVCATTDSECHEDWEHPSGAPHGIFTSEALSEC